MEREGHSLGALLYAGLWQLNKRISRKCKMEERPYYFVDYTIVCRRTIHANISLSPGFCGRAASDISVRFLMEMKCSLGGR